jgi:SAM-dependent methyltransferase
MDQERDYIDINRKAWNRKTEFHIQSDFYDQANFLKGKSSLKSIELDLLGDVSGKNVLHLQCHFGQDSISLGRLGAKVTGIDLSDEAIKKARETALQIHSQTRFICCNIYDLPDHLDEQFDIVFTSYGTIGWLPDMDGWAEIISKYLKPGGKFLMVDFHPVVWMFDDAFEKIEYRYLNSGPIIENEQGTYADRTAPIEQESVGWNHGIGEILNPLIKNGLEINAFEEFDYSPFGNFQHMVEPVPGKFRIRHLDNKIPMVYSILATKKSDW